MRCRTRCGAIMRNADVPRGDRSDPHRTKAVKCKQGLRLSLLCVYIITVVKSLPRLCRALAVLLLASIMTSYGAFGMQTPAARQQGGASTSGRKSQSDSVESFRTLPHSKRCVHLPSRSRASGGKLSQHTRRRQHHQLCANESSDRGLEVS